MRSDVVPATVVERAADRVADTVLWLVRAVADLLRRPLGGPLAAAWRWIAARLALRTDVLSRPSATGLRRLSVAGLVANAFIVVSGGLVRVTDSGLGCPTWPRCTPGSLVPEPHEDIPLINMVIEFGNRVVTFAVLLVSVLVFAAVVAVRDRRPDLTRLAVVLPLGVLAQGVLGGITVLSGLHPAVVGAHYLLSSVVLIACVALVVRVREADAPPVPTVSGLSTRIATVLPFLGFLLLAAGTVVTGAGPHAGDAEAERYGFAGAGTVEVVARVHSGLVWITLLLVGALFVLVRRDLETFGAPARRVLRHTFALILVILAQGLLGYVQYAIGVPAGLVLLHIAGSVAFWITVLLVRFTVRDRSGVAGSERRRAPATRATL